MFADPRGSGLVCESFPYRIKGPPLTRPSRTTGRSAPRRKRRGAGVPVRATTSGGLSVSAAEAQASVSKQFGGGVCAGGGPEAIA
ncbi:hypothetical protein GCM10022221_34770 [Actinocorallia aurea]